MERCQANVFQDVNYHSSKLKPGPIFRLASEINCERLPANEVDDLADVLISGGY